MHFGGARSTMWDRLKQGSEMNGFEYLGGTPLPKLPLSAPTSWGTSTLDLGHAHEGTVHRLGKSVWNCCNLLAV